MRPRGNWCRPDTALLNAALSNGNGAAILETARQRARNGREIREQGSRERAQHGWKEYVRGNELLVNTIPKVQFTLICADEHVDGIVDIICNAARTGAVGDGKIWVEPVEEVIRIRTGEHGPAAV